MSAEQGLFAPDGPSQPGMRLMARSFDREGRPFTWLDFLPKPSDRVWTWTIGGEVVSSMVARPLTLANGDRGVILGAVATVPERRRQGLASQLVEAGCRHYRDEGTSFVVMWARDYLLSLYEPLGFENVYREYYCDLTLPDDDSAVLPELTFGAFDAFSHRGLERRRLAYDTAHAEASEFCPTIRSFAQDRWTGIMDKYPFAPEFSLLFAPPADDPGFYAVIGHGFGSATIMEFAGTPDEFVIVRDWASRHFPGLPVKFNITAPHHQALADTTGVNETEQNMCLLYRQLDGRKRALPLASWVDRF